MQKERISKEAIDLYFEEDRTQYRKNMNKNIDKEKKDKKLFVRLKLRLSNICAILVALLVVISSLYTFVLKPYYNSVFGDNGSFSDNKDDLGIANDKLFSSDVVNVALFGVDTRSASESINEDDDGRSDSIMILSVDKVHKKVRIISVMRDSFVPIELNSGKTTYNKINSAYSTGGATLAVKTLNQVFGLDISDYATVNFAGMAKIIDAIGGIDIDISQAEINDHSYGVNNQIGCQAKEQKIKPEWISVSGPQHVSGQQAVAWARIRHVSYTTSPDGITYNDDYGRTERQRFVMQQMFDKVVANFNGTGEGMSSITLIRSVMGYVKTSFSFEEAVTLYSYLKTDGLSFETSAVPIYQGDCQYTIDYSKYFKSPVGSIVYFNLDFAKKVLRAFIYDDVSPEKYIEKHGVVTKSWYKGGSSGSSNKTYNDDDDDDISYTSSKTTSSKVASSATSSTVSKVTSSTASQAVSSTTVSSAYQTSSEAPAVSSTAEPTVSEVNSTAEPTE